MRCALALSPILLALLFASCTRGEDTSIAGDEAKVLLEDRNWLDAWPSSKDERLRVYRFTPGMGGGVFQDRTLFRGSFELFKYELGAERIRFEFPDADEVVTSRYRIERVEGPEPFDLRLTLEPSPRGPSTYYGRESESGDRELLFERIDAK